jgi:hypothetical protein
MNKFILLFFILVPFISFSQSQSEVEDKLRRRSQRDNPTINEPSTVIIPQTNFVPVYPYYNNFYNPYNPYIPYVPNRTFSRPPSQFSVGIKSSLGYEYATPTLGFYTNFGNSRSFFHLSVEGSSSSPYEHYDNITIEDVSLIYKDTKLDEFERYLGVIIGVGGRLTPKFSPIVGLNIYEIDKDIVYLDDTNILSSDGKYSINGGSNQNFNIMVGGYYQIGSVELGLQTYFLRDIRTGLTVGFVF